MFKFTIVLFAIIASVVAKPGLIGAPLTYNVHAAVIAAPAPVITATSSQVIARNYNGIATTPVIAPVAAHLLARTIAPVAAPLAAANIGGPLAYSTPLAYSAAPLAYAAAPALW